MSDRMVIVTHPDKSEVEFPTIELASEFFKVTPAALREWMADKTPWPGKNPMVGKEYIWHFRARFGGESPVVIPKRLVHAVKPLIHVVKPLVYTVPEKDHRLREVIVTSPEGEHHFPSVSDAARFLGVPQQVLHGWMTGLFPWPGTAKRAARMAYRYLAAYSARFVV